MSAMHQVSDFNEAKAILCLSCPVMCTFALTTGSPLLLRGGGGQQGDHRQGLYLNTIGNYCILRRNNYYCRQAELVYNNKLK